MSFLAWPAANSMPGTARMWRDALGDQPVEPVADDRPGEFQIAVLDRPVAESAASASRRARRTRRRRAGRGCRGRRASRRSGQSSQARPCGARRTLRAIAVRPRCRGRGRARRAPANAEWPACSATWPGWAKAGAARDDEREEQRDAASGEPPIECERLARGAMAARLCEDGPGLDPRFGSVAAGSFQPLWGQPSLREALVAGAAGGQRAAATAPVPQPACWRARGGRVSAARRRGHDAALFRQSRLSVEASCRSPERVRRAKAGGFDAVEFHFPYDVPAEELRAVLAEAGLPVVGINTRPGDVAAGDFGLAAMPGPRGGGARGDRRGARLRRRRSAPSYVHVTGRQGRTTSEPREARKTFLEALDYAAGRRRAGRHHHPDRAAQSRATCRAIS